MHSKPSPACKILVNLDLRYAAAREMISGILRAANARADVEVQFTGSTPSDDPLDFYRAWEPDALVTDATYRRFDRTDFAALAGRAAVFANTSPPTGFARPHAIITSDDERFARAVTDLFSKKKLAHLAYVGAPGNRPWSLSRARCLRKAARAQGLTVAVYQDPADVSWSEQRRMIAEWLTALPKPCGVWVAYDQRAKHVVDACSTAGLAIPDQVQILGTDNEAYLCEQLRPSLSSLVPDFEGGGFAAAEFLFRALERRVRKQAKPTVLHFGLTGIFERESTTDVNGFARRVAATREVIHKFAALPEIGVPNIATELGVSQRLLEKNYRAVTGSTVAADLRAERLDRVKALLRKTQTPIESIAPLCGFRSSLYLKNLFKRETGQTMSAFRRG